MRQVASVNVSGRITLTLRCEASDRGKFSAWLNTHILRATTTTIIAGGTATGLAVAPLPPTWPVTLTSLMKNSLIMRTFLIHMRPSNLPRQINPHPQSRTLSRAILSPVHRSHEPSINQSINCRHRFACDRKCFCQNTCSPYLVAALKYYSISAEQSHWPT